MITRLSLPIDILHDERIVALVADCGPESIAVLISILAIQRRRGSIDRDRYLIFKIRHDLSYTLDEAAINAILDHLTASGYIRQHREEGASRPLKEKLILCHEETTSGDTGRRGRLAPSCETAPAPATTDTPVSIVSPDSIDSSPASEQAAAIPDYNPGIDPLHADVWPHQPPFSLEEVIGAYRCQFVQQNLDERRRRALDTKGLELKFGESLAVDYYEQYRDSWIEHGYPVINLGKSLSDWLGKTALAEAKRQAKAVQPAVS